MDKRQDPTLFKEFSGLRNDVDPERFGTSDLAAAVNVDIDKSGRIARRAGQTLQIAGSAHSLWSRRDKAFFVKGSDLQQLNTDFSTATLLAGLSAARVSYTEAGDRVYFSNGYEKGVVEDGAVRSWGLPVPPTPGVAVTTGYMPAGIYQFTVTCFREDGQESGARAAGRVEVPDNSALVFTVPAIADPTVVRKAVYISTPNGDDMYLALTMPNDVTIATYANDTTELNLPLMTQFLSAPPSGHMLAYFKGRIFAAVGDILFYSEPFAYELFDLRHYIALDSRCTLLGVLEERNDGGGLFIGTDKTCGVLQGSDPDTFEYVPKTSYGAIEGAVDYVDGSLFDDNSLGARPLPMWLTTEGICVGTPGMEIRNLTRTKYGFRAQGKGAALFKPGPNQFIATSTT